MVPDKSFKRRTQSKSPEECLKMHNIDGPAVLGMGRKEFGSLIVEHCGDKKLRGAVSKLHILLNEFKMDRLGLSTVDSNEPAAAVQGLADCTTAQIVSILKTDLPISKYMEHRDVFVSYFEEHKIDGAAFLEMARKEFGGAIVSHGGSKKLNSVAMKVFKALSEWNDWTVLDDMPSTSESKV